MKDLTKNTAFTLKQSTIEALNDRARIIGISRSQLADQLIRKYLIENIESFNEIPNSIIQLAWEDFMSDDVLDRVEVSIKNIFAKTLKLKGID